MECSFSTLIFLIAPPQVLNPCVIASKTMMTSRVVLLLAGHTTVHSCYKPPHHVSTDSTIFRWQRAKGRVNDDGSIAAMPLTMSFLSAWGQSGVHGRCLRLVSYPPCNRMLYNGIACTMEWVGEHFS